ncbi:hypothetical protein [Bacillus sp. ok061]|nr:hypothetical protein [Bacillus sp. ok061]
MFYRKGTQDGKGVACLQEEYATGERCCILFLVNIKKEDGKSVFFI